MTIEIQDFFRLREELPVIDVRSEKEFADGHITGSSNLPILNNEERIAVGTDYKQKGQLEAIKTGFRLVGPRIIDLITEAEKITSAREMIVHCWRGGMRSANFCHFVGMARIRTHQLKGGYKAYRQKAIESYERPFSLNVIGGSTGSGKSDVLRALSRMGEQVIDLEQLASHKGSVFGGMLMPPQPTTEQFQNDLFENILKIDLNKRVWIEDESIAVGKIFLPDGIWKRMNVSPIIELNVPKEIRVRRLEAEYGHADKTVFLSNMERIIKKLGGQHFNSAKERLLAGDMTSTIEILLTYYDRAYATGLSKKQERVKHTLSWNGENADDLAKEMLTAVEETEIH